MSTTQQMLDAYQIARNLRWRYALDQFESGVLRDLLSTVDAARRDIAREFEQKLIRTDWRTVREEAVAAELETLSAGLRRQLARDLGRTAGVVGETALGTHTDILSVGGASPAIQEVALSAAQFESFFASTPLGGHVIDDWVGRAFTSTVQAQVKQAIDVEVLRGKGYRPMIRKLESGFGLFRDQAEVLTRTYVQAANVSAQEAVYRKNRDVAHRVKWSAALESGYAATGRGTCLRCAALDGRTWDLDETRPDCPLHPRCRCVLLPVTDWRKLDLPAVEIRDAARPYTVRADEMSGADRRAILEVGMQGGDYGAWFEKRGRAFRRNVVGPQRLQLIEEGRIGFSDLVDPRTGRLRLVRELAR